MKAIKQLHTRLPIKQVKKILSRYLSKKIPRKDALIILGLAKTRFHELLNAYKTNVSDFSIAYKRNYPNRKLEDTSIATVLKVLQQQNNAMRNPNIPIYHYNYSLCKRVLSQKYNLDISLFSIISLAKKHEFVFKKKKRSSERIIYASRCKELVQIVVTRYLLSSYSNLSCFFVAVFDDYSRFLLSLQVFKTADTTHISSSIKDTIATHGLQESTCFIDTNFPTDRTFAKSLATKVNLSLLTIPNNSRVITEATAYRLSERIYRVLSHYQVKTIGDAEKYLPQIINRYNNTYNPIVKNLPTNLH